MAQTLTLATDERASLAIGLLLSDGSVSDLGNQFRYDFVPGGIAAITGEPGAYYVEALSPGVTNLSLRNMAETFYENVEVTVTAGPPDVVPVGLAVSIGPAEPKP